MTNLGLCSDEEGVRKHGRRDDTGHEGGDRSGGGRCQWSKRIFHHHYHQGLCPDVGVAAVLYEWIAIIKGCGRLAQEDLRVYWENLLNMNGTPLSIKNRISFNPRYKGTSEDPVLVWFEYSRAPNCTLE